MRSEQERKAMAGDIADMVSAVADANEATEKANQVIAVLEGLDNGTALFVLAMAAGVVIAQDGATADDEDDRINAHAVLVRRSVGVRKIFARSKGEVN